jgi:integrase/recombinase XerC
MKETKIKFLDYLRVVRNASEHTIRNYKLDLQAFETYLQEVSLDKIDKKTIKGTSPNST